MTATHENTSLRIGFIHNAFPLVSETFISKEMTGLSQLGLDLEIYSLFRPGDHNRDRSFKELRPIFYLLDTLNIFRIIKAHLLFFFLFPLRYAATMIFVLRHYDGDMSFYSLLRSCVAGKELSKEQRQDIRLHFLLAAPLARRMRRDHITFINSHFADAAAGFAMLCARLLDLEYAVTAHAYDIFTRQSLLQTKLNCAKFILTCTHYNREILKTIVPPADEKKCFVFYHGIDCHRFTRRSRRVENSTFTILSVGRLVEKKGFHILIQACTKLRELDKPFLCQIVGDGPMFATLQELIRTLNLGGSVHLMGSVQPDQIYSYYEQADIFVLPCLVENDGNQDGIPNVIAEAMAMELPVITTNISGIPELMVDHQTGFMTPQRDSEALALAMRKLLESRELCSTFGKNGRERVMQIFDSHKCLSDLNTFYRNQLCNPE